MTASCSAEAAVNQSGAQTAERMPAPRMLTWWARASSSITLGSRMDDPLLQHAAGDGRG